MSPEWWTHSYDDPDIGNDPTEFGKIAKDGGEATIFP
jgi:hypothetical protein